MLNSVGMFNIKKHHFLSLRSCALFLLQSAQERSFIFFVSPPESALWFRRCRPMEGKRSPSSSTHVEKGERSDQHQKVEDSLLSLPVLVRPLPFSSLRSYEPNKKFQKRHKKKLKKLDPCPSPTKSNGRISYGSGRGTVWEALDNVFLTWASSLVRLDKENTYYQSLYRVIG